MLLKVHMAKYEKCRDLCMNEVLSLNGSAVLPVFTQPLMMLLKVHMAKFEKCRDLCMNEVQSLNGSCSISQASRKAVLPTFHSIFHEIRIERVI